MSATDTPTLDSLADCIADLQARVAELEQENNQLRDRVAELESDLSAVRDGAGEHRAELSRRLHDLEEREGDQAEPTARASDAGDEPTPQTPLEQVVGLPEHLANEQLSPNQDRARFVASDIKDYAESVPAGWQIESADLRRILQAYDESGHHETVARVMEMACDLGKEDVWTVKRRGTRRLVFSEELVDRLEARRSRVCDGPGEVSA